MASQNKKFLFNFFFKKRQSVFAFLLLILAGLIAPAHFAKAISFNPLQMLGDISGGMATALITTALQIPLFFANAFLGTAATLLSWVVSPSFISLPYTGMGNPMIAIGWPLMRDLANMGFVIALVFIGLGTALRISEYQVQKALPRLAMIALLINFTPVFLGVLVDLANITMNFFLEGLSGGETFYRVFSQQFAIFQNAWGGWSSGLNLTPVAQTAILVFFGFIAGFMILAYALIFLMRYVAIWMLVILSPIAFFCYALPATRKIWTMWWNQFVQWCFIGVFAAFFLYLSEQMIKGITDQTIKFSTSGNNVTGGFLDVLLPYGVVIILLIFGFFTALTTSAMGAGGVVKMTQKGAAGLPSWMARRRGVQMRLSKAASGTATGLGSIADKAGRLEDRASKVPGIGRGLQQLAKPIKWAAQGAHGVAGPSLLKFATQARKYSLPKEFGDMSIPEQTAFVKTLSLDQDKLVAMSKMADMSTLQKSTLKDLAFETASKLAKDLNYKKEVGDVFDALPDKITAKLKIDYEVSDDDKKKVRTKIDSMVENINAKASLDVELNSEISEDARKKGLTRDQVVENMAAGAVHVNGFKSGDVTKVAKGSLNSIAFRMGTHDMGSSHLQRLTESFDKETVEDILNKPGGLNTIINSEQDLEDFYLKNPRLANWFATNPAGQTWNWSGMKFAPDYKGFTKGMQPFIETRDKNQRSLLLEYDRLLKKQNRTANEESALQGLQNKIAADPELDQAWQRIQSARNP